MSAPLEPSRKIRGGPPGPAEELGVHEIGGWRIKSYRVGSAGGSTVVPPHEFVSRAVSAARFSAGDSRVPVGYCLLAGGDGGPPGLELGLWILTGQPRLAQVSLAGDGTVNAGIEISIDLAQIRAFEIDAMTSALQASQDREGIEARYLTQWYSGTATPSRARMLSTLGRFSNHWRRGEIDGLMEQMSDAPSYRTSSGRRFDGREAVRKGFAQMCTPSPKALEQPDEAPHEVRFFGNCSLTYWSLMLPAGDGSLREVEGVDIITYDPDGRISIKDAYRKSS